MKVIFLDIDGVLNCIGTNMSANAIESSSQMSSERVGLLNYILDNTDAQIVISSTWRKLYTISELQIFLMNFGLKKKYHDVIVGSTPSKGGGFRGREIEQWLKDNPVDNFVILDDDSDMLPEQLPNFVNTRYYTGLTFLDAELAIAILNEDEKEIESIKESYRRFMWKDIFNPDLMHKEKNPSGY